MCCISTRETREQAMGTGDLNPQVHNSNNIERNSWKIPAALSQQRMT